MPYTFAKLPDVDYMICDDVLPETFQKAAEEAGVILL